MPDFLTNSLHVTSDFLAKLLDTSDFPARWQCGNWTEGHGLLHIASDIGVWAAYTAIPIVLAYYVVRRHKDMVFPRIFWLFCCFILFCGLTHLVEATIFWWPWYRLSGVVKLLTAIVSWMTVIGLVRITPQVMTLPGLTTINEQLRNEIEERTRAEQRFRQLVESSPNAIVMVDRRGKIVLVNAETEKLFGYSRDELIGETVELLVPHRLSVVHSQLREAFFQKPEARPMGAGRELFGQRKDGSLVPVEIGLNPIDTDEGRMVLSAITDITARKQAESSLRELNQQLRRKNVELEQFVNTVSHDLKTPLVTISGFVGMLRDELSDHNEAAALDAAERIERATGHMTKLIEDLLRLSRIGRATDTLKLVQTTELVRVIADRLSTRIEDAGVQLKIQKDMPAVLADRSRLGQLFENLLCNAIKYGCDATHSKITVGGFEADGEARFFVRDYGPGIAPEYHEKIFGLFQRLDSQREGTGVGLAIVSRIVEAHGARVWVESKVGAGATFWIGWPLPQELPKQ